MLSTDYIKRLMKDVVHRLYKEIQERDCPRITQIYTDYLD